MGKSIVTDIAEKIKKLVLDEKMKPGDKLPSERVLSSFLGVSRNALREALKTIEAWGLLDIRQGSGIYLKDPSYEAITVPIMAYSVGDKDTLLELIEARKVVDVEISALAARRSDDKNIIPLTEYLDRSKGNAEYFSKDGASTTDFESLIGTIAGNRILSSIQEATHVLWRSKQKEIGLSSTHPDIQYSEHMLIYKAIVNKDEIAAREAMIYHIESPLRHLDM